MNGDCAVLACLKEVGSNEVSRELADLRFIDFGLGFGVWFGLITLVTSPTKKSNLSGFFWCSCEYFSDK